jgi:cytochrome c-type protein NapB
MRSVYLVAIALGVASLLVVGSLLAQGEGKKDNELGLSKSSVFDTPAPEPILWNTSEPGELALPPRDNPEFPPVIPHGVAEFLPITFNDNQCVDCHEVEQKEEGEATPIPESHFEDLRRARGTIGENISGARYNCMGCHVTPGQNEPLVGNSYLLD